MDFKPATFRGFRNVADSTPNSVWARGSELETNRQHLSKPVEAGYSGRLKSYQRSLQIRWIPDGLRHSFATYWLGVHQNRNRLAELMGNSPAIIGRHYLKPVSRSEAQRFWLMTPPTV